jgi:hypothetical protein
MKSLRWTSKAALLLCFAGGAAQAQVDQVQLVEQLRHGGRAAQFSATQRVLDMGPELADPSVREALILALADEGERRAAWRRGEAPRQEHPEMIARMAWVASHWEEPQAIEPLAKALGTGSGAIRGLARFGEPAVRAAVEAARTREGIGSTAIATDALLALRFLAEGVGRTPLSDTSRELITTVARERLQPRQPYAPILRRAIDLAVVLGDPELMEIVEAMASDPAEVEARLENPEPERVEQTRQRAAERLSGEPPRPRWDEWSQLGSDD